MEWNKWGNGQRMTKDQRKHQINGNGSLKDTMEPESWEGSPWRVWNGMEANE